jgi:hypothetical protein
MAVFESNSAAETFAKYAVFCSYFETRPSAPHVRPVLPTPTNLAMPCWLLLGLWCMGQAWAHFAPGDSVGGSVPAPLSSPLVWDTSFRFTTSKTLLQASDLGVWTFAVSVQQTSQFITVNLNTTSAWVFVFRRSDFKRVMPVSTSPSVAYGQGQYFGPLTCASGTSCSYFLIVQGTSTPPTNVSSVGASTQSSALAPSPNEPVLSRSLSALTQLVRADSATARGPAISATAFPFIVQVTGLVGYTLPDSRVLLATVGIGRSVHFGWIAEVYARTHAHRQIGLASHTQHTHTHTHTHTHSDTHTHTHTHTHSDTHSHTHIHTLIHISSGHVPLAAVSVVTHSRIFVYA